MAKTGTLITVASDQNGATPRIVTETEPFPVALFDAGGGQVAISGGSVGVILNGHRQIHQGNGFTHSDKHSGLAGGTTATHLIVTGANSVHIQYFDITADGAPIDVEHYSKVITSADGSAASIINNNDASSKTPTFGIYDGPTITDAGDRVAILFVPDVGGGGGGGPGPGGGGSSTGGNAMLGGGEWILAPNSKYSYNVINNSGGAIDYAVLIFAYEPAQGAFT